MLSRTFLANGFWVTIRYAAFALLGIGLSLGFAHLAPKEVYGQYQFVLSLLALFSVFTLPGLNMAALKAISEKKPAALIEAVERSFRSSLYAVPIILLYGAYIYATNNRLLGGAIMGASVLFPFFYAPNTWYTYYEGQLRFRPVAIRTIIATVGATTAVLAGLYLELNVAWIIILFLAVSSLFSIYFYLQVKQAIQRDKTAIPSTLDLAYSHRVTAQKFAYTLSESLPPLAVAFFLGNTALASFQVANVFLSGVSGLIGALAAISLPLQFSQVKSSRHDLFSRNLATGAMASLGYWIVVQLIFLRMYGSAYEQSYILAQLLAGLPLLISMRTFLVNHFTAQDKNALIVTVYVIANLTAFVSFGVATQITDFTTASTTYLYVLNIALFFPLLWCYFQSNSAPNTTKI